VVSYDSATLTLSAVDQRKRYKREFAACAEVAELYNKLPPALRTKAGSIRAGQQVENKTVKPLKSPYKGVDVFTKTLPYHDKNAHTIYDQAHQFSNVIKQSFTYVKNKKSKTKLTFTKEDRNHEQKKMKRFLNMGPRPPWVASKKNMDAMDAHTTVLKTPTCWPEYRKVFKDLGFLKTSETLLLAGPVPTYAR
jgi:hypothetical protein